MLLHRVMSNREIQQLIYKNSPHPTYIPEAMVKQVTWEDQWIGYDDDETIAMKVAVANDYCMGGTMVRVPNLSSIGITGLTGGP
jgi:chitinase